MPFHPPSWVRPLPYDPPDSVSLDCFMFDDQHRPCPLSRSRPPFTCGITGKTYSAITVRDRVDHVARALAKELAFDPNAGRDVDKVVALFSLNTIDTLTLAWATHRLGGVQSPANAAYSAAELAFQLKDSGAKALFTCLPLLDIALDAAKRVGLPENRIYLMPLPSDDSTQVPRQGSLKTLDHFDELGRALAPLPALTWSRGEGARRMAFLCYSSGTSGLPKGVMISHRNVIANVIQTLVYKSHKDTENVLALLPLSHIYGLVYLAHLSMYRGDSAIVLPRFDFKSYLAAIERFQINDLYLVPPIMILMTKSPEVVFKKYNLSSVRSVTTGAAPLGAQTARDLQTLFPRWKILQGYGMTETSPVVCTTATHDVFLGSSGSLLPGTSMRLVTIEGNEIEGYDQPGELWVKSPSVTLGYLNNPQATRESFLADGWLRTGDEALVRPHPESGHEHIFIVDRLKELIKVNGLQVAPAELEAHLLTHPAVNDCVVIGVPSDREGEVPKAFVVKSSSVGLEESDVMLKRDIARHVERHKAKHKWLKGGIEFVDVVPKSPSGKILRRLVRDKEREKSKRKDSKL